MNDLDVCNWALLKLGQRPLLTSDRGYTTHHGELCKILLSPIHRSLLRSFVWSFASRRTSLSPLPKKGKKEERIKYALPKLCLRVISIEEEGVLEGDAIFTDANSSIEAISIHYIEDVPISECDPLYQEAIALKLSSELCLTLTGDGQLTAYLKEEYEKAKEVAIEVEGIEIPTKKEYLS